jgi:hypothetical protein
VAAPAQTPNAFSRGRMLGFDPLFENRKKCLEKKILFGNKGKLLMQP